MLDKIIKATDLRFDMLNNYPEKIQEEVVQKLLLECAEKGEFELYIEQNEFAGDIVLLSSHLEVLGYNCMIFNEMLIIKW